MTGAIELPALGHAKGSAVFTPGGTRLTDLLNGYGAVFMGHCDDAIVAALKAQADRLWSCGRCPTEVFGAASQAVQALLPGDLQLAGFYSTGMEAAEFAMRVAAQHTGRAGFVAFSRSMHGKSIATAALSWPNTAVGVNGIHALPYVDVAGEDEVLAGLSQHLQAHPVAAVFVEPIQGSNSGHAGSARFHAELLMLCRRHGALCIFDEILTGLYRTGPVFVAAELPALPDIILFGKSMGNGFPVSAVALQPNIVVTADCLPGSTFAANPLACAAVLATVRAMQAHDLPSRVAAIEAVVRHRFAGIDASGITLRGRGALWLLELAPALELGAVTRQVLGAGVLMGGAARTARLLPGALIDLAELDRACALIAQACRPAHAAGGFAASVA
jgi:acetylornithine/succinyldiaminopimelate/putrescine aminotransferase